MDWAICPLCGYDSSPGGGCYCWEDAPPAEKVVPTFSEWHSGDVGRPVITPADQERLRALSDEESVHWADGQTWEMSGLAISHWPSKVMTAKALRTFLGI